MNSRIDTRRYFQDKERKKGKRERTRASIMDSVVTVVANLGLDNATVQQITEEAGLSHGTFYNHFDSRDDAIKSTASSVAMEIDARIMQLVEPSSRVDEAFVLGTKAFLNFAFQHPDWGKLLTATLYTMDGVHDESFKPLRGILGQGAQAGIFRTPITPLLLEQIGLIIVHSLSRKLDGAEKGDLQQETCAALLRLLGRTFEEARKTSAVTR